MTLELRRFAVEARRPHPGAPTSSSRCAGAPLLLARLLAESALARQESRGAHFRSDFPLADEAFEGHIVQRLGGVTEVQSWP